MSALSITALASLLFSTLFCSSLSFNGQPKEDGFTFDFPEDLDIDLLHNGQQELHQNQYEAIVGQVFHLAPHGLKLAKDQQGYYIAKQENSKGLPHWLVFNKKTGTFWGVPLPGDEGNIHIKIQVQGKEVPLETINIRVVKETDKDSTTTNQCKSNEDNTILTFLLDKNVRTIKPKQRVIAINNIAKYFRLPYSAFTIKPQLELDDITDSSVVLAGPGNIHSKSSKISSVMEILVGCDGRLWESTASLVHNLKQEARDGTIAEVLRLPLMGWRVKTETKPILRNKRQTNVEDYGSGDYDDDYYDDYEDDYNENDEDNLSGVEGHTPISRKPATQPTYPTTTKGTTPTSSTSTTTTTTTEVSSTHAHRHHHGEIPLDEENELNIDVTLPMLPKEITTVRSTTTTTQSQQSKDSGPTKINIPKPADALNEYDGDYDYDAYDEEGGDDIESATIVPNIVNKVFRPITEPNVPTTETITKFEDDFEVEPELETTSIKTSSTSSTTVSTTSTTSTTTTTTEATTQQFDFAEDTEQPAATIISEIIPEVPTEQSVSATTFVSGTSDLLTSTATTTTTTTEASSTVAEETEPEIVPTISELSTTITTTTTSTTTTESPTTEPEISLSTRNFASTTTEETIVTDVIEPVNRFIPEEPKNTRPYIENRLQYQSVTAGKVFRYVIPKNTFKDAEDGYNLTLQVLDNDEQPISKSSWLQFNPLRRELYGLPLANDVSNWMYIIRASDKEGEFKQDQLTIQVQQHRLERVVNHEFILKLRIEKPQEYPHYIDWSLRVLRALGRVYGTNMSEITVRHINHTSDPVVFVWSNDSLPTTYCPRSEIEELYKALTANDRGDPSREMSLILSPDIRIKKIANRDLTTCEQQPTVPVTPSQNFSPILRNPVDKINAVVGELLIFKVKDDTFYDPEDVDPSALNITLLTSDLGPIPSTDWLQFDNKNREFYGIPRKTGITEYFLLCVDTGGMSAKDSLEVVVNAAPKKPYNVEFGMTIGVPFETFSNSASMQRKFVEKLMEIFDEPNQYNFHFLPFKPKRESNFESTGVYWFNKSLPLEYCAKDEIKQLEQLLHSDSRSISSRVHRIMAPEFTVSTIKVHHVGNCKPKLAVPTPEMPIIPEATQPPQAQENDVMLTLILPIIIIAIMLFVASVAACILYRKRKQGKMNVEEDGRNGSYGNKGIPVIFQEELEEKPDPGTKAPVILKDEKPPLAPPEYSKSGSVKLEDSEPYQPPPPFTRTQENGRQPRPKPTPTYRKPPPYV
ncbi:dystroglycan 1 isoform X2 [Anthonomus grandis grandis]|nr:dystroglycan 1 isoform X2 [Anthonomus grandis grandis]